MDSVLETWFPEIPLPVRETLGRFEQLFREWNGKLNLVSRKDMDDFVTHHLVHSLALAKWAEIPDRCRILDVGTGGGLPGLPLAICFPHARVYLCDSITKKARAVRSMVDSLGLTNVEIINKRAETLESKWDYILGRAVTSLPKFTVWIRKNISTGGPPGFPNGILYWKGSLFREELAAMEVEPYVVYSIREKIPDPYFEGKFIIHLTRDQVLKSRLPEGEG